MRYDISPGYLGAARTVLITGAILPGMTTLVLPT